MPVPAESFCINGSALFPDETRTVHCVILMIARPSRTRFPTLGEPREAPAPAAPIQSPLDRGPGATPGPTEAPGQTRAPDRPKPKVSFMIRAALTTSLATLLVLLGGCQAGDYRALVHADIDQAVILDGPAFEQGTLLALDIENVGGSIQVRVEPHLTAPTVEARTRWKASDPAVWTDENPPSTVTARFDPAEAGRGVLTVRAGLAEPAPEQSAIDLVVLVPQCHGLRIRNGGGPVQVVGVQGAVTIQNGLALGSAGDAGAGRIEVRTGAPISDPIALTTTRGPITLVTQPRGAAEFDLVTGDGDAQFRTAYGTVRDVKPEPGRYRGVWNGGTAPVTLQSGAGRVRVIVHPRPEGFTISESRNDIWTD